MPNTRQIYLLDPQKLSPETIAVTFAKTSRFPQSFREIADELTDEKSAEFHEKWVVGYGHSSIAEHAVLHIAVENVSRLAIEALESNRLASYTEKSTRYQKWGPDDFYLPKELEGTSLYKIYVDTCRQLFESYLAVLPMLQNQASIENPIQEEEAPSAWERRVKSIAIDCCRFLLPASALANVGVTINARALEHALQKMLSSKLQEVIDIGREIKEVARKETPTLVKYANAVPYLQNVGKEFINLASKNAGTTGSTPDWCQLVHFNQDIEKEIFSAALYKYSKIDFGQTSQFISELSEEEQKSLARALLGELERYDIPLRELEYSNYTFDLILDQGAYCELKRHRMMTQTPQALTTNLGYALPKLFSTAGVEKDFRKAMESAQRAYNQLAQFNTDIASYVVPNAYNRRVLFSCNLRSADHFVNLRTAKNTHFSMRRVAHRVGEQIKSATPILGSLIRECIDETWQDIETRYFTQTR